MQRIRQDNQLILNLDVFLETPNGLRPGCLRVLGPCLDPSGQFYCLVDLKGIKCGIKRRIHGSSKELSVELSLTYVNRLLAEEELLDENYNPISLPVRID